MHRRRIALIDLATSHDQMWHGLSGIGHCFPDPLLPLTVCLRTGTVSEDHDMAMTESDQKLSNGSTGVELIREEARRDTTSVETVRKHGHRRGQQFDRFNRLQARGQVHEPVDLPSAQRLERDVIRGPSRS